MGKRETDAFKKWAREVAAKLPDNLRNSWTAVTDPSEDFVGQDELVNAFLRQDDYTRKTTEISRKDVELQRATEELEGQRQQLIGWYNSANTEYQNMYQEYSRMKGSDPSRPSTDELAALKAQKDELMRKIQQVDQGAWTMATRLSAISHRALKDGYTFEPDAIAAYSAKNHVPLETAFEALTADERAQKREDEVNKRIETAREEARREAMSKHAPPDSFGNQYPTGTHIVDSIKNNAGVTDDHKRREEALKAFYESSQS